MLPAGRAGDWLAGAIDGARAPSRKALGEAPSANGPTRAKAVCAMTQTTLDDYAWLVERRSQIQSFLFKLYTHAETKAVKLEHPWDSVFDLLIGAAFSLWRAAFLIVRERNPELVRDHAKHFLELLVRDNAIAYTQDRQTHAWTVGYYLNNAYFRLMFAVDMIDSEGKAYDALRDNSLAMRQRFDPTRWVDEQQGGWDLAYLVAEQIYAIFEQGGLRPSLVQY